MAREPLSIILRLFAVTPRESGLLGLAVARGVGTAASGISLVAHTREYSRKTLASPACREIVVSTHDEADEMEAPVVEKPVRENAVLTSADLSAAEIVPAVTQAYVSNESRLRFFTAEERARLGRGGAADGSGSAVSAEPAFPAAPPSEEPAADGAAEGPESAAGLMSDAVGQAAVGSAAAQTSEAAGRIGPGSPPGFRELTALIEASAADPDVIIPGVEEMRGYSVTPEFFDAWGIRAAAGSLFSRADMEGNSALVVLGSKAAELVLGNAASPFSGPASESAVSSLVGRKLLAMDGYRTIIGILEPTGDAAYDERFFEPWQDPSAGRGRGFFRPPAMNTQLRVAVGDPWRLDETAVLLAQWFEREYGEGQIVISNPRAEAARLVRRNTGIGSLILFLSLSGLFIAAVNVSNMLVSRALRMRRYVGILMALGSPRKGIRSLFAAEALLIAVSGSILGTILALPLSASMRGALGIGSGSSFPILAGAMLSWGLVLLVSLLPARRYGRIDPAEAMRDL
jgi:putative ABC transport system permease protein